MGTSKLGIFHKLFSVVFCLISLTSYRIEGKRISISKEEDFKDLELERQLRILNKPPIKTIHAEWGDIIDCIDIHKQPAFDHPALKNHKIQMRPTSSPKKMIKEKTSKAIKHEPSNIRTDGIECPNGTVPIKRTTKEDLIRAKSLSTTANTASNPLGISAVIILENEDQGIKYYGANADMYAYNPSVGKDQFSAAQFWIESSPRAGYASSDSIQAGWIVAPQLYNDHLTRLFSYWTGNGSSVSGCYNTLCPGFVQVHPRLLPSSPVSHISTYGGPQYALNVYAYQDRKTKDWWLIASNGIKIGYWPKALFSDLGEGADRLKWGGSVSLNGGISPPMGSGPFLDGHPNHTCYFTDIMFTGEHEELVNLGDASVNGLINCKKFYNLNYNGFVKGFGNVIEVGGPGGKCG